MAGWIKMPLGMEEGLDPGDFVRWGPSSPPHVHCGQTAEWIKMSLGIEVGLGPGYIVLDWDCDTALNATIFTHQSYPFAHLTSFGRITKFITVYGS